MVAKLAVFTVTLEYDSDHEAAIQGKMHNYLSQARQNLVLSGTPAEMNWSIRGQSVGHPEARVRRSIEAPANGQYIGLTRAQEEAADYLAK